MLRKLRIVTAVFVEREGSKNKTPQKGALYLLYNKIAFLIL